MGRARRLAACGAACCALYLAACLLYAAVLAPAPQPLPEGPPVVVREFSAEEDAAWLPALAHGEIVSCEPFDAFDAYADKFVVRLADGRKAMLKLVEKHTLLDRALRTVAFDAVAHAGTERAEAGAYQGMPELAAWHLDRALGLYRKPPIAGRRVPSSLLYPSLLTALLPAYAVPVTLHGWAEGLRTADPALGLRAHMVAAPPAPPPSPAVREQVAQISDVLAFDFLVDDHDRAAEKNWVLRGGQYLLWDNGLGWRHGPAGADACLDVLCGSNTWRRAARGPCPRVCVFRKQTVDALAALGPGAPPAARLGFRLRASLQADALFPAFQFPIYYADAAEDELVRYPPDSFFDGMDVKLERLLQHVDTCIALYGRDRVLL